MCNQGASKILPAVDETPGSTVSGQSHGGKLFGAASIQTAWTEAGFAVRSIAFSTAAVISEQADRERAAWGRSNACISPARALTRANGTVALEFAPKKMHVFGAETGRALLYGARPA